MTLRPLIFPALLLFLSPLARADGPPPAPASAPSPAPGVGATIRYQLPVAGPLPRTYRVTLAVVDAKDPDWIVGQFACGVARTVTAENGGRFAETWDGLDDNHMPVPPGEYGVKGIYMPAERWRVDGEYHTVTPQFVCGASAWLPGPGQWDKAEPFGGDPCGAPLTSVAVGPNGAGVFYYGYLENGLNAPVVDLNKPVGYEQFVRAFGSGGAAGGAAVATDGAAVWAFSTDGSSHPFVHRTDGKPFGTDRTSRAGVFLPQGWVTAMTAWRDEKAGRSLVYVAERGKVLRDPVRRGEWAESDRDFVDRVTVREGEGGKVLADLPLPGPRGLAVRAGRLYALHAGDGGTFVVSAVALDGGVPRGAWERLFAVPAAMKPFDLQVDGGGRVYLSDPAANHVYRFDAGGKLLLTFGRQDAQKPGAYDPLTFMGPGKLAAWTDGQGKDRLVVVEQLGPNRASEWDATGHLLREFQTLQTKANDGYAVDPLHPEQVYIAGQGGWLTRFKVDYDQRTWTVDAVWPDVGTDPAAPGFDHPQFVRAGGRAYLACARSYNVYRQDGDRWLLSAAVVRKSEGGKPRCYAWHDANGDGVVQEEEYRDHPLDLPGHLLRYHGEQWLDDLSLAAMNQGGRDVWRLAPAGFDAHGNPVFGGFQKLLTDPVFEARAKGEADAAHGGNELDDRFSSDWAQTNGSVRDGFYVNARGGHNFSANEGAQVKISRYVPDGRPGHDGYRLRWRTGRSNLGRLAEPGEIYAAIHLFPPINGLLSVIDQSRCGVLLYTEDGLYVDTVFPDGRRLGPARAGVYALPGEFFAGTVYPNADNGKVYFGMGKYTPMLFEARGWSLKENPVRPLADVQKTVRISAAQVAAPPEVALSLRGGAGSARVARFAPALGGAALDGSLDGWESCEPVKFEADTDQSVELRGLYDPEHLYLRWHARLAGKFEPAALEPIDRIFTHDRLADTLSLYLQGDPSADPAAPGHSHAEGRPGDVRIVFGLFKDGGKLRPAALAMYPKWPGPGAGTPLTYATPGGKAAFENVAPLREAALFGAPDPDGKGLVVAAAVPRSALPGAPAFGGDLRTMVNFSATFGGHNKFWWANSDGSASRETYDEPTEARLYPGSWAPLQFQGLGDGVVVRNWLVCGPFGGEAAKAFKADANPQSMKEAVRAFCEAATYPPDAGAVDPKAVFSGDLVRGYWPDPREVRWKPAMVADLDTRVVLGPSGQTWYGATWVHAPRETPLEFRFQGRPQAYLRFFLNGQLVSSGEIKPDDAGHKDLRPVARKTLTLRPGWNEIRFRGYCTGYPPFRAGLVLTGQAEALWKLKLTATPPAGESQRAR